MPTTSHEGRLTYEDLLLFPDDGLRHEIIDGAHYVTPSPNQRHHAQNIHGTPALVIEVMSPSTRRRDREVKRRLYERTGVREYWLVDPELNAITVYRRAEGGSFPLVAQLTADANQTLETPLVPGWSVKLVRLLREVS